MTGLQSLQDDAAPGVATQRSTTAYCCTAGAGSHTVLLPGGPASEATVVRHLDVYQVCSSLGLVAVGVDRLWQLVRAWSGALGDLRRFADLVGVRGWCACMCVCVLELKVGLAGQRALHKMGWCRLYIAACWNRSAGFEGPRVLCSSDFAGLLVDAGGAVELPSSWASRTLLGKVQYHAHSRVGR